MRLAWSWRAALAAGALLALVGCKGEEAQTGAKSEAAAPKAVEAAEGQPAEAAADEAQPAKEEPAKEEPAKADPPKAEPAKQEVVFDPAKPPPGYVNCHRDHCHKVGGGVASYAQVMQEMGATKMAGGAQPAAMPDAPPDVAAPPADAERTASGLASKVLSAGRGGANPGPTDMVTVHYTGWTTDGKAFDSSIRRGRPATFPLNGVIAGWTEGLQLMSVGEERRFWIPENLAYGGRPGKPAGMLVFDVELIDFKAR